MAFIVAPASPPHSPLSQERVREARRAISLNFLLFGMAVSSWAPMVPLVKERLEMDEATLGLALLGMGAGGLVVIPISGVLMHWAGTQRVMAAAAPLVCAFLPALAFAPTPWLLGLALFCFSASLSTLSISMNSQAIEVDKLGTRPVLSRIHGIYSLGALSGSALMSILLRLGVPLLGCAAGIGVALAALSASQVKSLLPGEPEAGKGGEARPFRMPPRHVLLLGSLCAILFVGEGSMLDWSAVFLHSNRGFDPSVAGLGYTAYAVLMTASRFLGDGLTQRFGAVAMLRSGVIIAIGGLAVAILLPWGAAGLVGFGLVGFGLANTVPVVFAASGRVKGLSPRVALPIVTTLGCSGLVVGPAVIGMIAKGVGLPAALGCVGLLLAYVGVRARVIETQA